jgi:hypothetical protein
VAATGSGPTGGNPLAQANGLGGQPRQSGGLKGRDNFSCIVCISPVRHGFSNGGW